MAQITLTPEQSAAIVALFDKAADANTAFGAPGDYGYGTKEGDALFGLARALVEAHPVVVAIKQRGELRQALLEISGHLGAALVQSIDSDDQIIMSHVREAQAITTAALKSGGGR